MNAGKDILYYWDRGVSVFLLKIGIDGALALKNDIHFRDVGIFNPPPATLV